MKSPCEATLSRTPSNSASPVGRSGVERVLEVGLSPEEERLLRQSAEVIRENGRA